MNINYDKQVINLQKNCFTSIPDYFCDIVSLLHSFSICGTCKHLGRHLSSLLLVHGLSYFFFRFRFYFFMFFVLMALVSVGWQKKDILLYFVHIFCINDNIWKHFLFLCDVSFPGGTRTFQISCHCWHILVSGPALAGVHGFLSAEGAALLRNISCLCWRSFPFGKRPLFYPEHPSLYSAWNFEKRHNSARSGIPVCIPYGMSYGKVSQKLNHPSSYKLPGVPA